MVRPMSASANGRDEDPPDIAHMYATMAALRDAGQLSPEGCRVLAQTEAVAVARREMEEVNMRLQARLEEIDKETEALRKALQ